MHQWMFWNLASKGTKLYLMYPVDHDPEKTKYNVRTPRLGFSEFIAKGFIGRISCEETGEEGGGDGGGDEKKTTAGGEQENCQKGARFLIAPTFFSHHVITSNLEKNPVYFGSGGFGSLDANLENKNFRGV